MVICTLLNDKYPHKEKLIGDIVEKAVESANANKQSAYNTWELINENAQAGRKTILTQA